MDKGEISFACLYMVAMDAILHADGTDAESVDIKIKWYEEKIRRLLERAYKNYETVNLYIFSDHGMTDIHDACDLMGSVNALGLTLGVDYSAVYDSTMARFWFHTDLAKEKIVSVLSKEPKGEIMSEELLRKYGCDFADSMYGKLFFLMRPGVLLCPSFMGETVLAGMHGYAPEDKDSVAMFASNVVMRFKYLCGRT